MTNTNKTIKKSWTREEVVNIVNRAINFGYGLNFPEKPLEDFFPKMKAKEEWFERNIK